MTILHNYIAWVDVSDQHLTQIRLKAMQTSSASYLNNKLSCTMQIDSHGHQGLLVFSHIKSYTAYKQGICMVCAGLNSRTS